MAARKRPQLKWQPLAPPTPRILNLPRRHVRKKRMLEALFDEERTFGAQYKDVPIVVLKDRRDEEVAGVESEMLRAECRFLRVERELALKKVKRNRARMERILRSAMQTLISGRDKVAAECSSVGVCESLDVEIEAMRLKLVDLHMDTRCRTKLFEHANLNDQCHIPREIQELCLGVSNRFTDVMVETNGLMKRSNVSSSASTELPDLASSYSIQQGYKEGKEGRGDEELSCSGRCRDVVRRVAEQVRYETEQWSQVQEMLEKVKVEMEQLQASKCKWEQQALVSQDEIISLNSSLDAWKTRALSEEVKVNDLHTQVNVLQEELKMLREGTKANSSSITSSRYLIHKKKQGLAHQQKENGNLKIGNNVRQAALRDGKKQLEVHKRSPFLDIGNSSPLMRQITKVVFPSYRR